MARFEEDVIFEDPVVFQDEVVFQGDVEIPDETITDDMIKTGAEISASKTKNRHSKILQQDAGVDVVARTSYVHIARAAGTLKHLRVRPIAKPVGGDKQYTVDIKKVPSGTAVGAGTSLLGAPLAITSADTDNVNKDATLIGSPVYSAGDMLVIIVTPSGTTGTQGQGVVIQAIYDENGA